MKYVTSTSTPVTEWMAMYIVYDARKTEYQVNFSTTFRVFAISRRWFPTEIPVPDTTRLMSTFQIFSDLTKMVSNRNSWTRYYQISVNILGKN